MNTYIFIHGGESFNSPEEYKKWITSTLVEWNTLNDILSKKKRKMENRTR